MSRVVITGASGGLGSHLASAFWLAGYDLVLVGRELSKLATLRTALGSRDGQTILLCRNNELALASPSADCLICNAAEQGPIGPFEALDMAAWATTVEVNLVDQARVISTMLPHISDGGTILFLAGGGATGPRPNFTAYAAAKAGLVRFAETLAVELMPRNITVNSISPGVLPTAMLQTVAQSPLAGGKEVASAVSSLSGDPEAAFNKATKLALFLASDRARHITGKIVSAVWDNYEAWPDHAAELLQSDAYTLRRLAGRDRGMEWGDV